MPTAHDIPGAVFKNGSVILLARIIGASGRPITRAVLSAAKYTVFELDASDPDSGTPVAGHTDVPLGMADIIFDSLRRDSLWDADAVGYNFKHEIDVSVHQAFAHAGLLYRVRYELTPAEGQVIVVRFKLRAI